MPEAGDRAPDFTVPLAHGDDEVDPFTLSAALDDGPIVLAFFPGAFTGGCRTEMRSFQADLSAYEDRGARVFGVSVDSPFALNEFRARNDLAFGLLSDTNKDVIEAYDVRTDFEDIGFRGLAQRAVFVVDSDQTVTYRWIADDAGKQPDFDAVLRAVEQSG